MIEVATVSIRKGPQDGLLVQVLGVLLVLVLGLLGLTVVTWMREIKGAVGGERERSKGETKGARW
jgi:hypothetical protein